MAVAGRLIMGDSGHRESTSWTRVIAVAAVLFFAQVLPSPFRRHAAFRRFGPDKVLHFVGYAWFAGVLADALAGSHMDDREAGYCAVAVTTIYNIAMGELQEVVPGRVHERADFIAGFLGSMLGVVGWRWRLDNQTS